jgi:hypothetical protein
MGKVLMEKLLPMKLEKIEGGGVGPAARGGTVRWWRRAGGRQWSEG